MRLRIVHIVLIAVFCSALLGVTLWTLYAEYNRPWKGYQREFNRLAYRITKNPVFKLRGEEIQQVWLKELGIVDRCITCHQAEDREEFRNAPHPFRTHSDNYLKFHPVGKFGCVVCHQGQGPALTVNNAHSYASNWTRPVLKGPFVQSSCGKCHFMEQKLPLSSELSGARVFSYGWRLFQESNCIGCHKLKEYKRPDRIGPSLTAIGNKIKRVWLVSWLKNPKDYLPKTKMPRYNLRDEEVDYIADYLLSLQLSYNPPLPSFIKGGSPGGTSFKRERNLKSPSLGKRDKGRFFNRTLIKKGKKFVNSLGCLGCHKINNTGNDFAPDLSDIGNKIKTKWLLQFLKNPRAYDPKTIIPDLIIPDEEILSIVAYLMSLKKDKDGTENVIPAKAGIQRKGLDSPVKPENDKLIRKTLKEQNESSSEDIQKGKKLVKDLGCTGCHEIEKLSFRYTAPELDGIGDKRIKEIVFNNKADVDRTLTDWLMTKVMDPGAFATDKIITRMPNFDFNEKQAVALVTFLLSIRDDPVPPEYKKRLFDPYRAAMEGKKVIEKYNCLGCHRINKEGGDVGPDLTTEANKSRPEWLFAFLKRPHKIRPEYILKARMPNFNLSDKETGAIIEYLSFISEEPYPYFAEPVNEISPDDVRNGEKLYQEIFACSACHIVDGHGGEVGPDHTDVASRLKREWIKQWLKDPQAIKPNVRMPRFKFEDWEFEALTNYLMTLGKYRFVQMKKSD